MAQFKKFDADTVLTSRDVPALYQSIQGLAKEFAVLGQIKTAKSLISLLLSQYSSDWQLRQIKSLKFAFAEVDEWPDQIPQEERTEEALDGVATDITPDFGNESDAEEDDPAELGVLLETAKDSDASSGGAAMERSNALATALAMAIRLASRHTSSIEEIEADPKVQKALGYIAVRMHGNQAINRLTEHRTNWRLLSTGALARKIPVDMTKVEAFGQEVIATFTERLKNGRHAHPREKKSIRELLDELNRNTRANGTSEYEAMGEEVPESLFVLPPATDEQISALERRLDIVLPDDYEEFFKISNGFGGTWNGYYLEPPLHGVDDVEWAEFYGDILPIELHESPTGNLDLDLPGGREWPTYGRPIELGSEDVLQAQFIPPHDTRRAIEAYKECLESPETPDAVKQHTRKLIASKYGSWEAFEKLEWVAMDQHDTESVAYGTFTQFLQERVQKSEMGKWEGQGERDRGSFAYSCVADNSSVNRKRRFEE
ncbi:SMI1-KNR4 domain-containing protein [Fusarium keratoplasticum]|nr:SMI1-KNR4 domain-containing protein [Fusarium keratoplasticum]